MWRSPRSWQVYGPGHTCIRIVWSPSQTHATGPSPRRPSHEGILHLPAALEPSSSAALLPPRRAVAQRLHGVTMDRAPVRRGGRRHQACVSHLTRRGQRAWRATGVAERIGGRRAGGRRFGGRTNRRQNDVRRRLLPAARWELEAGRRSRATRRAKRDRPAGWGKGLERPGGPRVRRTAAAADERPGRCGARLAACRKLGPRRLPSGSHIHFRPGPEASAPASAPPPPGGSRRARFGGPGGGGGLPGGEGGGEGGGGGRRGGGVDHGAGERGGPRAGRTRPPCRHPGPAPARGEGGGGI